MALADATKGSSIYFSSTYFRPAPFVPETFIGSFRRVNDRFVSVCLQRMVVSENMKKKETSREVMKSGN